MDNNEQSQHLEYFKVENFKGLESLELKEIQQFNLILGDNNIGKTSVLEALLFDEKSSYSCLVNLKSAFEWKQSNSIDTDFDYISPFIGINLGNVPIRYSYSYGGPEVNFVELSVLDAKGISDQDLNDLLLNTFAERQKLPKKIISIDLNGKKEILTSNLELHRKKYDQENWYHPFVKAGLAYYRDLEILFSRTVNSDMLINKEFISSIQVFSKDISNIIISLDDNRHPVLITLFNDGSSIPLFMMGDGTIRLVRLILEIIASQGKRLMIDEIDNGMHFSKMKKVWEVVLKVAAKYNTQLFVTTHDSECLRAFIEVLESEELKHLQEKVASYTLFRNKENKVDAVKYDFRGFEHSIDNDLEVRS
jgi:AAA15 family ATPase/GTPase